MADLKLHHIMACVEDNYKSIGIAMYGEDYETIDDVQEAYHKIATRFYFMHDFGILSTKEYSKEMDDLHAWLINECNNILIYKSFQVQFFS